MSKGFVNKTAVIMAAVFILSGCSDYLVKNKSLVSPTILEPVIYKHGVNLVATPKALREAIKPYLTDVAYLRASSPFPADINAVVKLEVATVKKSADKPILPGKLGKAEMVPLFNMVYGLTSATGRPLLDSKITQEGQPQTVFLPLLAPINATPTETEKAEMLRKVGEDFARVLKVQTWRTSVLSQQGDQHIMVDAGREAGLKYGDFLHTEAQPLAKLQVVTFDAMPEGGSRATLRLIEGTLPDVGKLLVAPN